MSPDELTTIADDVRNANAEGSIIGVLRQSVRCILRLFGGRVHMRAFLEVVKQEAVLEAQRQLEEQEPTRQVKRSELAMRLGLDGRVISRIQNDSHEIPHKNICPEAALLHRWARDRSYHNTVNKQTMVLAMYGASYSFSGLVSQYFGRGVSAPMVAKKLAEQGCVEIDPKGWIRLKNPNWEWMDENTAKFLHEASYALESHTASLLHNLECADDTSNKWIERRLYTAFISEENRSKARCMIQEKLKEHRAEIIDLISTLEDSETETDQVLGVGIYYWESKN